MKLIIAGAIAAMSQYVRHLDRARWAQKETWIIQSNKTSGTPGWGEYILLDASQTNSSWAGWYLGFSNGVDGPAFVSQKSKDGTRIIKTLPVLHEPKKK
jgi:hypothetical protein